MTTKAAIWLRRVESGDVGPEQGPPHSGCADGAGSRIVESPCVIVDELVHSVLMQPNWIGIASDEFVDLYAIYCFGAPNSHLFPVNA